MVLIHKIMSTSEKGWHKKLKSTYYIVWSSWKASAILREVTFLQGLGMTITNCKPYNQASKGPSAIIRS